MSKVYVIQEDPKKNLTRAKEYGQLVILMPPNQVTFDSSFAVDMMEKKLKDFDYDEDFLLLVGDPVLIAIASAIVAGVTGGIFKVLKWDRLESDYNALDIDVGDYCGAD